MKSGRDVRSLPIPCQDVSLSKTASGHPGTTLSVKKKKKKKAANKELLDLK